MPSKKVIETITPLCSPEVDTIAASTQVINISKI